MKFLVSFCVLFIVVAGCAFSDHKFNCSEVCSCPLNNHETEELNPNIENCPEYLTLSLLNSINDLRQKNGLSHLNVTSKLNQYSQVWANYLAHRNLQYNEPYNIFGSNLIFSYRASSTNILDGKEVLDFWINQYGISPETRSESYLETLLNANSEFIGFGCASSKVVPSRSVSSKENDTQHLLVVNIEINSNKPMTTPPCSVRTPKSRIPVVLFGSTLSPDQSSTENNLNYSSNLISTVLNNVSTYPFVKPIIIHSAASFPNKQSTIHLPASSSAQSLTHPITIVPRSTRIRKQSPLSLSATTKRKPNSKLTQGTTTPEPIPEPNLLINPSLNSSTLKQSTNNPNSITPSRKSTITLPASQITPSNLILYQNTKPRTTTTTTRKLSSSTSTATEPTSKNKSEISFANDANNFSKIPKN